MPDHATSEHPAVQAQLDRLTKLSPGVDTLGLDRIGRLLARLGDPQHRLPPVFHVAGTNGKGSTCAFLRAAIEAAGLRAHVYSSPHLVRFNERIRIAGSLIADASLAALLAEVLDHADGIDASFFEITTAAAFLAFARTPAAATIVEVGLGGRLDATNVIEHPAATGIAALGIDHQAFLGDTLEEIAVEKAGIAKPGVPLVTMRYPGPIARTVRAAAIARGTGVLEFGDAWSSAIEGDAFVYRDARGELRAPSPSLPGAFQADNYGLALALLRHQQAVAIPERAMIDAGGAAHWPARLQRLATGPLVDRLDADASVLVDGAHNASAAEVVAQSWPRLDPGDRRVLVIGMLANKDAAQVLDVLAPLARYVVAVPVLGHACHAPEDLAARARADGTAAVAADSLNEAIDWVASLPAPSSMLIAGSLYLAGQALGLNDTVIV